MRFGVQRRRLGEVVGTTLAVSLSAAMCPGQEFRVLGRNPQGQPLIPTSLSPDGGWCAGMYGTSQTTQGFVLGPLNELADLPLSSGASGFAVLGVAESASCLVGSQGLFGGARATRWGLNRTPELLSTSAYSSHAFAVNRTGSVVVGGIASGQPGNQYRSFRWTQSNGFAELPLPPTSLWAWARAVSGDGAVTYGTCGFARGSDLAFRWTAAEGTILLSPPSPYRGSEAVDTNAMGTKLLARVFNPGGSAAVWEAGQGWMPLGSGLAGLGCVPASMSEVGAVVVGGYYGNARPHAMLWTSTVGMKDIQSLLELNGVDLTGWQLTGCNEISEDGRAILGYGELEGEYRSWLVHFPDPFAFTSTPPMRHSPCRDAVLGVTPVGTGPFTFQWQRATAVGFQLCTDGSTDGWAGHNARIGATLSGTATAQLVIAPDTADGRRLGPGLGLQFRCIVSGSGGTWASPVFSVAVCASDINCDDSVDGDDVLALFTDWDAGDPDSDFNNDGSVDGDDVIQFFERWDSGC
jgi:uncharacterized membrane protein